MTGLQPGSSYDYWVVATSSSGTTESPHATFRTRALPPVIADESVSNLTEHDAKLEAQINANGGYTGYEFQIDTVASYNFDRPNCPFEGPEFSECESIGPVEPVATGLIEPQTAYISAGQGSQTVSIDLAAAGATLESATTYHYRLRASSVGNGIITGPDRIFTTPGALSTAAAGENAQQDRPAAPNAPQPDRLTSPQKLANAMKLCHKKPKRAPVRCEVQARRKHGRAARRR